MLIGLSGKMQSGKDTVTKIIQWLLLNQDRGTEIPFDRFDLYKEASTWKNVKFADKLKDIVCLLLGCTREQLEDPIFKETPLGEEWVKYELRYVSYSRLSYDDYPEYYEKYFLSKEEAVEYIEGNLEVDQDSINISKIELTPRLLLQLLGTECGREIIHPDIWVNATFAEYKPQHFRTVKHQGSFVDHLTIMPENGIIIRTERFCYDSSEDFLVCNPDPELRKIGIQDYNINKTLSLKEITDIAKAHGYVPLSEQHESEIALDNYTDWDYVIDNNGTIEDLIEKVKEILTKEKIWKEY